MQDHICSRRIKLGLLPATIALLALTACGGGTSDASAPAQTPATLSLFAGNAEGIGNQDGAASIARFSPGGLGLAIAPSGDLMIADTANNAIRKLSNNGQVSTMAGGGITSNNQWLPATVNHADGSGAAARFSSPTAVAIDTAGNTYVADRNNHVIRKIDPAGKATTLAGQPGQCGNTDGMAPAATFCYPSSIAVDGAGNVYVAETGSRDGGSSQTSGNPIRKISAAGVVTTVAFKASQTMSRMHFSGGVYLYYYQPVRLTVDAEGALFVADPNDHVVRKFERDGTTHILSGTVTEYLPGYADGTAASAKFGSLDAIALDRQNNVYVLDSDGTQKRIRKITSDGSVSTVVQSPRCSTSFVNAGQSPCSASNLAVDIDGSLLVNDFGSMDGSASLSYALIRRFAADGTTSSVAAGSLSGYGWQDGTGGAARFAQPSGLSFGKSGTLYVADTANNTIRSVSAAGETRTLGIPTNSCNRTEPGKVTETSFCLVETLAVDEAETLYVPTGNRIMKVTPAGDVTQLADLTAWVYSAQGGGYDRIRGIASVGAGNVYVAMETSGVIFRIASSGQVDVFAGQLKVRGHADGQGSAALFSALGSMTSDDSGNLYVIDGMDYANQGIGPTIRKITPAGVVSTIAGKADAAPDWVDGARDLARFRVIADPSLSSVTRAHLAIDQQGHVYISDPITSVIRKIDAVDGQVSTLIGQPGLYGFTASALPGLVNRPAGVAVKGSRLYFTTSHAIAQTRLP